MPAAKNQLIENEFIKTKVEILHQKNCKKVFHSVYVIINHSVIKRRYGTKSIKSISENIKIIL